MKNKRILLSVILLFSARVSAECNEREYEECVSGLEEFMMTVPARGHNDVITRPLWERVRAALAAPPPERQAWASPVHLRELPEPADRLSYCRAIHDVIKCLQDYAAACPTTSEAFKRAAEGYVDQWAKECAGAEEYREMTAKECAEEEQYKGLVEECTGAELDKHYTGSAADTWAATIAVYLAPFCIVKLFLN